MRTKRLEKGYNEKKKMFVMRNIMVVIMKTDTSRRRLKLEMHISFMKFNNA